MVLLRRLEVWWWMVFEIGHIYLLNYRATKQSFYPSVSALFCKRESKKATTDDGRHGWQQQTTGTLSFFLSTTKIYTKKQKKDIETFSEKVAVEPTENVGQQKIWMENCDAKRMRFFNWKSGINDNLLSIQTH